MFKVGLTGGVGCGKSTIAKLFQNYGITIIDADQIAREVVQKGSKTVKQIAKKFGNDILTDSGELDRKSLREKVFSNESSLEWLNNLMHPQIRNRLLREAEKASGSYVILDIPLLFENKLEMLVDRILVVDIPVEEQVRRVIARDSVSEENVKAIINRQISREIRLSKADDIIDNTIHKSDLKSLVDPLHQQYLSMSKK
ncbi:MAG: dephospho-CoA kinase [Gammaproteobacteria bacterium]|nr:dephospho-CoA kinase [Gammaproteobacteria bacterium]